MRRANLPPGVSRMGPESDGDPGFGWSWGVTHVPILEGGGLALLSQGKPTRMARDIPQSHEKCSMIFNGSLVNSADARRPKGFHLLWVRIFFEVFAGQTRYIWRRRIFLATFGLCFSGPFGDTIFGCRLEVAVIARLARPSVGLRHQLLPVTSWCPC